MEMSIPPARTRIYAVGEVLREAGELLRATRHAGHLARGAGEVTDAGDPQHRAAAGILVAGFSFRIGRKPLRHEQTPCT